MQSQVLTGGEHVVACDICGGDSFTSVAPEANVTQCARCGYRFVNPRPSMDEIAVAYSDPYFYDGWLAADEGRLRMWMKRLKLVRKVAPGPALLDVGAGIGTFLALGRDIAGWNVTGTEVSTSALSLCRKRYGIELLHGQLENLALPAQSFHMVTLWHVLEHVPSPSWLLEACYQALVPGGVLVVAVPNDDDAAFLPGRLKDLLLRSLGRARAPRPRYEMLQRGAEIHLSHFTPAVLVHLLEKKGFSVWRVTVDDHYAEPTWKTELRVQIYRWIMWVTRQNLGVATLVVAKRV